MTKINKSEIIATFSLILSGFFGKAITHDHFWLDYIDTSSQIKSM
jgi:hypothetical protein